MKNSLFQKLSSKLNSLQNLSQNQKKILAFLVSFLVLGLFLFGYNWFTNPGFKYNFIPDNRPDSSTKAGANANVKKATTDLTNVLSNVNPENLIYEKVKFKDLPIYPKAWVEKNFTPQEQLNALVSGPSGDADSDGLNNKQEYLYGSNPKNKDSLCNGKIDNNSCFGRTDKQNIDMGISPLTGFELESPTEIKVKKQDLLVVDKLQDTFNTATKEGVDFVTLYQLSKTIDLSDKMNEIKVVEVQENTNSMIAYQEARVNLLKDSASDDDFSNFVKLYQLSTLDELNKESQKYRDFKERLAVMPVPKRYVPSHKAYIMFFDKMIELTEHRKTELGKEKFSDEFRNKSKTLATEAVWAYKKLNTELSFIEQSKN